MARYIITVADKDIKEMDILISTLNEVFIKEWGDDAVIVEHIEKMEDAQE
jgi:hypothetical protein